jgi:hypothetical protein
MLRISVACTEGASANPSARIIIMIWWTNIAWLSQTRAARRITAWTMFPAIGTLRPTATQPERRRIMFHMRRAGRMDRLLSGPHELGAVGVGSIAVHLGGKSDCATDRPITGQAGNQTFGQKVVDAEATASRRQSAG